VIDQSRCLPPPQEVQEEEHFSDLYVVESDSIQLPKHKSITSLTNQKKENLSSIFNIRNTSGLLAEDFEMEDGTISSRTKAEVRSFFGTGAGANQQQSQEQLSRSLSAKYAVTSNTIDKDLSVAETEPESQVCDDMADSQKAAVCF
jgi:hypothetical protein